jgi:hypothetical protein
MFFIFRNTAWVISLWLISIVGAYALPFKDNHYLDARFVNSYGELGSNEVWAQMVATETDQIVGAKRIDEFPLQTFVVIGKWWTTMGDFIANTGIEWSYKDDFPVKDASGKTYWIRGKMFEEYPSLARRLKAARISFSKIKVRVEAHNDEGQNLFGTFPVEFTIDANDVIVPPHGEAPYMAAPGSPAKWSDKVTIFEGRKALQSDEELRKVWSELKAIKPNPEVTIYGLRIPTDELVAIAKLYEQYKKDDKKLEESYDVLKDGYRLPKAPAPYAGGGPLAKPYQEEIKQGKAVEKAGEVVITAGNRETFRSGDYWLRGSFSNGRYFLLANKESGGVHLFGANGQRVKIGTEEVFADSEQDGQDGTWKLFVNDSPKRFSYTSECRYGRLGSSYGSAIYSAGRFERFKQKDYVGNCEEGVGFFRHWNFASGRILTIDEQLHLLKTEPGYVRKDANK